MWACHVRCGTREGPPSCVYGGGNGWWGRSGRPGGAVKTTDKAVRCLIDWAVTKSEEGEDVSPLFADAAPIELELHDYHEEFLAEARPIRARRPDGAAALPAESRRRQPR